MKLKGRTTLAIAALAGTHSSPHSRRTHRITLKSATVKSCSQPLSPGMAQRIPLSNWPTTTHDNQADSCTTFGFAVAYSPIS